VNAWDGLTQQQKRKVAEKLLEANADRMHAFMYDLENAIIRQVERVFVLPLHGKTTALKPQPTQSALLKFTMRSLYLMLLSKMSADSI
jgi:hypothetical protein